MSTYIVTATWRHRTFEGASHTGRVSEDHTDTFILTDIHPAAWYDAVSESHLYEEDNYKDYTWWRQLLFFAECPNVYYENLPDWTYMAEKRKVKA